MASVPFPFLQRGAKEELIHSTLSCRLQIELEAGTHLQFKTTHN